MKSVFAVSIRLGPNTVEMLLDVGAISEGPVPNSWVMTVHEGL